MDRAYYLYNLSVLTDLLLNYTLETKAKLAPLDKLPGLPNLPQS